MDAQLLKGLNDQETRWICAARATPDWTDYLSAALLARDEAALCA
jgi:hypothetical protein